jgi:hypothetical protein
MLQVNPAETIMFQKNNNHEFAGNVEILNVSKRAVTYKVSIFIDMSSINTPAVQFQ